MSFCKALASLASRQEAVVRKAVRPASKTSAIVHPASTSFAPRCPSISRMGRFGQAKAEAEKRAACRTWGRDASQDRRFASATCRRDRARAMSARNVSAEA